MIENMITFANEHRTLLIVIIAVLFVCFIYWYLCCKNRKINKFKGGEICTRILKLIDNRNEEYYMMFIGAKIISDKYPLFTLNEYAHMYFIQHGLVKKYKQFFNHFINECEGDSAEIKDLKKILESPIGYICENCSNKPSLLMCMSIKDFFSHAYDNTTNRSLKKYSNQSEFIQFNFEDYFGDETNPLHKVLDYYKLFEKFVHNVMHGYVYEVVYVGQPAKEKLTFIPTTDVSLPAKNNKIRFEKQNKGELSSELYDKLKKVVRGWYNDDSIKQKINHLYFSDKGEIKRENEQNELNEENNGKKSDWQIADIYPAYKMLKMIFLLLAFSTKYIGDQTDFMKMIASYVAYVQLFNSFCAVKMKDKWNGSISNSYVYEYKNNNNGHEEIIMNEPDYNMISRIIGEDAAIHAVPSEKRNYFIKGFLSSDNFDNDYSTLVGTLNSFKKENKQLRPHNEKIYDILAILGNTLITIMDFINDNFSNFSDELENQLSICDQMKQDAYSNETSYSFSQKSRKQAMKSIGEAFKDKINYIEEIREPFNKTFDNMQTKIKEAVIKITLIICNFRNYYLFNQIDGPSNNFDKEIIYLRCKIVDIYKYISSEFTKYQSIEKFTHNFNIQELIEKQKSYEKYKVLFNEIPPLDFDTFIISGEFIQCYYLIIGREIIIPSNIDFFDKLILLETFAIIHDLTNNQLELEIQNSLNEIFGIIITYSISKIDIELNDFGYLILNQLDNWFHYNLEMQDTDKWDRVEDWLFKNTDIMNFDTRIYKYILNEVLFDYLSILDPKSCEISVEESIFKDENSKMTIENIIKYFDQSEISNILMNIDELNEIEWYVKLQDCLSRALKISTSQNDSIIDMNTNIILKSKLRKKSSENIMIPIVYFGIQLNNNLMKLCDNYQTLKVFYEDKYINFYNTINDSKDLLEKLKEIHKSFLYFFDDVHNSEEMYQNLVKTINDSKIMEDDNDFILILYMINTISLYKNPKYELWDKIEQFLKTYKKFIKKYDENTLFQIFKFNKRTLLFLFEEKIITINSCYRDLIRLNNSENELIYYFSKEFIYFKDNNPMIDKKILSIIDKKIISKIDDNFIRNRKNGENENFICKIIRDDSITEFIDLVNKEKINKNNTIKPSKYETSILLQKNEVSYIEYAAFFGSKQIFNYLKKTYTGDIQKLLIFSIHGGNLDIVNQLFDEQQEMNEKLLKKCLKMTIKSHNIDIYNYLKENYLNDDKFQNNSEKIKVSININIFQYYNFSLINGCDIVMNSNMFLLVLNEFKYFNFLKNLLKSKNFDLSIEEKIMMTFNDKLTILKGNIFHINYNGLLNKLKQTSNIESTLPVEYIDKYDKLNELQKSAIDLTIDIDNKKILIETFYRDNMNRSNH